MAHHLHFSSQGSGTPLVFIHGWGLNAGVWQPTVEALSDQFHVTTVDLPGFGTNVAHTISPYSLDSVTELISQVIDQPAVIVGWSLGGLVATKLALAYPEKVKGVVAVASSPHFVESEQWPGIKPDVLALFHRQLSQNTQKTIDNFLKIQAMGSPHIRQDIKVIRELIMQFGMPSKATLDESLRLLDMVDLRDELQNISVPYFRMYGKLDSLVPQRAITHIDKLIPQSEKIVFDAASHAPFISHFEPFVKALRIWLTRHFS
ncbi:pimeloyl-ACP methyl ester esterase BioH [Thalassotalea fusca]